PVHGRVAGLAVRTEPFQELLDPRDFSHRDATEMLDPPLIILAARQQLDKGLNGDHWILNLVRHPRGEHFEVGDLLRLASLHLELSYRRQITEYRDGADDRPGQITDGRGGQRDGQAGVSRVWRRVGHAYDFS